MPCCAIRQLDVSRYGRQKGQEMARGWCRFWPRDCRLGIMTRTTTEERRQRRAMVEVMRMKRGDSRGCGGCRRCGGRGKQRENNKSQHGGIEGREVHGGMEARGCGAGG